MAHSGTGMTQSAAEGQFWQSPMSSTSRSTPKRMLAKPVAFSSLLDENILSAGQLAPGGNLSGKVCFTDPGLQGSYVIRTSACSAAPPSS